MTASAATEEQSRSGALSAYARTRATAGAVARRLHADYLLPERLDELHALLRGAVEEGYRTMTLAAFAELVADGAPDGQDRILLLRHDIDTDAARARRMWEIELRLGLVGSYYFRLSTWDLDFMHALTATWFEVGYHYEELATVVKERGAATAPATRELLDVARSLLRANVPVLRAASGLAFDTFASHGDFANRAVGVSNVELFSDRAFREELGVRLEAYDIEEHVSARSSDGVPPRGWRPHDPMDAIRRGEPVVAILLHPRGWGAAPASNLRADLDRLREGCAYRLCRARVARTNGRVEVESSG